MSDFEDDWVPNRRPISALARSFSAALNDAFQLSPDLDNLSQSVEQKRRNVSSCQSELEELEAKIWQAEELLKEKVAKSPSARGPGKGVANRNRSSGNAHERSSPVRRSDMRSGEDEMSQEGPQVTRNPVTMDGQRQVGKLSSIEETKSAPAVLPVRPRGYEGASTDARAANRTLLEEEDGDDDISDDNEDEESSDEDSSSKEEEEDRPEQGNRK